MFVLMMIFHSKISMLFCCEMFRNDEMSRLLTIVKVAFHFMQPTDLSEGERILWNFLRDNGQTKPGFYPVGQKGDSTNPRVCKFGGSMARLPSEESNKCAECGTSEEVLVQLYVPSPVQAMFPPQHQKSLLIVSYCTECMESNIEHLPFKIYTEDQLDQLVFSDVSEDAKIEPVTITGWNEFTSWDCTSDSHFESIEGNDSIDEIEMETFGRVLKRRYHGTTYLLGFPYFEQGEVNPGGDYRYLMNFEKDSLFSMMWGDAGEAQLWMTTGEQFGDFYLFWCGG